VFLSASFDMLSKSFNYIDFSQHNNKLTTIIFIVYSYMFRFTWVIFRLALYLFAMSLCSFWDPRLLHVFVIYHTVCNCSCSPYDILQKNVNQSTRTFVPINTCRIISHNTITMTFVTTSNYNKVDNVYANKHVKVWDPRMSTVTLQTNIVLAWRWLMWIETCSYKL